MNDKRQGSATHPDACPVCEGVGLCVECGGEGDFPLTKNPYPCKNCKGSGMCPACKGTGRKS